MSTNIGGGALRATAGATPSLGPVQQPVHRGTARPPAHRRGLDESARLEAADRSTRERTARARLRVDHDHLGRRDARPNAPPRCRAATSRCPGGSPCRARPLQSRGGWRGPVDRSRARCGRTRWRHRRATTRTCAVRVTTTAARARAPPYATRPAATRRRAPRRCASGRRRRSRRRAGRPRARSAAGRAPTRAGAPPATTCAASIASVSVHAARPRRREASHGIAGRSHSCHASR